MSGRIISRRGQVGVSLPQLDDATLDEVCISPVAIHSKARPVRGNTSGQPLKSGSPTWGSGSEKVKIGEKSKGGEKVKGTEKNKGGDKVKGADRVKGKQSYRKRIVFCLLVAAALIAGAWWMWEPLEVALPARIHPKTLIMYSLLEADVANGENLVHFINEGVKSHPGCVYMILLHSELRHQVNLPDLPAGASYEFHDSPCSPWGAYAWVLRNLIGIEKYAYFVFVDSLARGPFVAPYTKGTLHWSDHLTQRLSDQVKLVGASISCESVQHWDADAHPVRLDNPHVQRYLFATDQEGMLLLMQAQPPLFGCSQKDTDHPQLPEKSMSKVMLEHGFTLDCLMLRYQGVNWKDKKNWDCNARLDPSVELQYDGTNLSPIEVMFAPAGAFQSSVGTHTFHRMLKYAQWQSELLSPQPNVNNNGWKSDPVPSKAVDVCVMERRGSRCFDHNFYRHMNPELKLLSHIQLWKHFVQFGQFEGRQYRFACEMDWESLFNEVSYKDVSPPPPELLGPPIGGSDVTAQSGLTQAQQGSAHQSGVVPALSAAGSTVSTG